jgi:hypothetical protein
MNARAATLVAARFRFDAVAAWHRFQCGKFRFRHPRLDLTRRANHWHSSIIAKVRACGRKSLRAFFFVESGRTVCHSSTRLGFALFWGCDDGIAAPNPSH